jgi:ABC-2 type transport system permease protein
MRAIWKREMQNYYLTPIGYVFMGIFLLVGGVMFFLGNVMSMTPSVATLLGNLNYIFMLTVPILTMRLFSEEKRTKTDQLLITSPRGIWDIVLGKFMAAASVVAITTCCTLLYVFLLRPYTNSMYPAAIACNYLGFLQLSLCYVALGLLMSAVTESQVSAAVLTLGVNLLLEILESVFSSASFSLPSFLSFLRPVLSWFSLYSRYNQFAAGRLSFANMLYYLSFAGLMLFLTVRVIDRRRWSEG